MANWTQNPLTKLLGIQYPLIQGPFGGGFSTVKLAAAVSNAGGLGSFGAQPYPPEKIVEIVRDIRAATDRPFAMNLWVSNADEATKTLTPDAYAKVAEHYRADFVELGLEFPPFPKKFGEDFDEQMEAIFESRPPVLSFVFGIPSPRQLERCRELGIRTIGAATTLDEALAVENAGVDAVVVSGFEAGGHRPSFLRKSEDSLMGLGALISQCAERVKIPLIAAGGIVTAKHIEAARVLSAQGFQLGTAFLACEESGATGIHKEILFSERARYTTLSRHFTGRLARFIENEFIREKRTRATPFLPYPAQNYFLSEFKKVSALRDLHEVTALYAGQGAPHLRYRQAGELIAALVRELGT